MHTKLDREINFIIDTSSPIPGIYISTDFSKERLTRAMLIYTRKKHSVEMII